jgi:catalase
MFSVDYHLLEKIGNFDHERIPERVVHARGASAKGFFEVSTPPFCYQNLLPDISSTHLSVLARCDHCQHESHPPESTSSDCTLPLHAY